MKYYYNENEKFIIKKIFSAIIYNFYAHQGIKEYYKKKSFNVKASIKMLNSIKTKNIKYFETSDGTIAITYFEIFDGENWQQFSLHDPHRVIIKKGHPEIEWDGIKKMALDRINAINKTTNINFKYIVDDLDNIFKKIHSEESYFRVKKNKIYKIFVRKNKNFVKIKDGDKIITKQYNYYETQENIIYFYK